MKRLWLGVGIAALVAIGVAWAQVPPNGSGANGWSLTLADATNAGPKVPITASATGTTAAIPVTLAADATKTNFLCGFTLTSGGTTTGTVGNATITGLTGGTLNFAFVMPSVGQGLLGVAFPACLSGSAKNVAIVVTQPAGGTGTIGAVAAWGYKQ